MADREHRNWDQANQVCYDEEVPAEQQSGARFTNRGTIPPVQHGASDAGVSASDRAFGDPDIEWLARTYDPKRHRPDVKYVAREIQNRDRDKLLAWIREHVEDGYAEANAVQTALEELDNAAIAKREAKKPHIEGGGLVTHELAPTLLPPGPALETNDPRKTHQEREEFERQRDAERQLHNPEAGKHEGEDKKPPLVEQLERSQKGAPPKTDEEKANEEKLTDPSHRRDVTPPGVRKKHER